MQPFQGKNIDSNVSQKPKKYLEGNERGLKERKIEREERRGTEKEMLENGFFANLAAIKILSHRYPSFVLGDFQTQIKYYYFSDVWIGKGFLSILGVSDMLQRKTLINLITKTF